MAASGVTPAVDVKKESPKKKKKNSYKCHVCGLSSPSGKELREHMKVCVALLDWYGCGYFEVAVSRQYMIPISMCCLYH